MKMNATSTKQTLNAVIGIDLGDKKHAVCVLDKDGNILREFSIANQRACLDKLPRDYPQARVALEVGTHSPWISRQLSARGMEVIVANARKVRAIYQNERKCDRLDAMMLARFARLDPQLLHPIRHGSDETQRDQLAIKLRDSLVRARVSIINAIRSSLKSLGVRLPSPSSAAFARQARDILALDHPEMLPAIEASLKALEELSQQISHYDKAIENIALAKYPEALHLRSIAGIGPITSLSFVLAIEDPHRFKDPRDVGAYLGLVPRRDQSGDTDKQLPISKCGNAYLRRLLVSTAQYLLGHFGPDCDLRRHGLKLSAKGGKAAKKKAVTAVARKLAVLMLTLWQKQSSYTPLRYPERNAEFATPASSTRAA